MDQKQFEPVTLKNDIRLGRKKGKRQVPDVGRAGRQNVKGRAEAQSKEAHLKSKTKSEGKI
jgi:hypothetical protein